MAQPQHLKARPRGGPRAAAMRAARGYSDIKGEDWCRLLGVSKATLHRYETGAHVPDDVLQRAAEHSGLPLEFLQGGDPATLTAASGAIDAKLAALQAQIDGLKRAG